MDVPFALAVIFTGIVIVFIVLVLLIAVMMIMGKLLYRPQQPSAPSKPEIRQAPAPAPAKAAPKPIVESGIEEETVAVISAAIAAFTGGKGRVAAIRAARKGRSRGEARSSWSAAGLRENTQPF